MKKTVSIGRIVRDHKLLMNYLNFKDEKMSTKIEWTNETWNPIIGCSKISEGCKNCYAEKMACRLASMEHNLSAYDYRYVVDGTEYMKPKKWNGKTFFAESQLQKPLKLKKPRKIFVCSMGDLFHESVSFEDILKVYDIFCQCPQHTFQILTKRPERMKLFFIWLASEVKKSGLDSIPSQSRNLFDYLSILDNVWLGVTAENQEQANKRIPILLQTPAKVKFVSVEPMLGEIDLFNVDNEINQKMSEINNEELLFSADYIDWVICGGETGGNARMIKREWVEYLQEQCEASGVPFFFKSWGGKNKNDSLVNGREFKEFPKV